jgi:uncharacterized membrane protein YagU involved in acid resistance
MSDTSDRWLFVRKGLLPGAVAGVVGGLVFGAAMLQTGELPTIASLVRATTVEAGFVVHMAIAALIGAGFGLIAWHQRTNAGEMLLWGLAYGAAWWLLGPLTLLPVILGFDVVWTLQTARDAFPSLLGHLWYGAATALAYTVLRRLADGPEPPRADAGQNQRRRLNWPALVRGGLAGLLAGWFLAGFLHSQGALLAFSSTMMGIDSPTTIWAILMATGVLAGVGFAALYPESIESPGAGLIRGMVYGFGWWVAGAVTLVPLIYGGRLAWLLAQAQAALAYQIGFILFGALLALFYRLFTGLVHRLFSDVRISEQQEGIGARGLRTFGRGILAGLVGGLLFTLVMVQIGYLPVVAHLIGADTAFAGLVVHLTISVIIGVLYGLLFQRQSYDVGSALGWGISYGFLWWIFGALTLMPMLLGSTPQWNMDAAAVALPSLIGHLLYGVGLALTFFYLETRYNPWWQPRQQVEAERAARRREQLFAVSPAIWVMIVVMALTLSVVLSTSAAATPGGVYGS